MLLTFIYILLILLAIVLIVAVLMQEGNRAGLGAIGGGAETFFGKSKAKGIQGKLQMITKIVASAFIVLAIVATAMTARQNAQTTGDETVPPSGIESMILPDATDDAVAVPTPALEVEATPAAEAVATPAPEAVTTPAAGADVTPAPEAVVTPAPEAEAPAA